MSITAKELAEKLNISAAAVSMALNGKPGVSTETRKLIIEAAHNHSYDFTKVKPSSKKIGSINFLVFKKHGAIVNDSPFFKTLTESIAENCKGLGYKLNIQHLFDEVDISEQLNSILSADCVGIILLGTEMQKEDFLHFVHINTPIVLVDTYFESTKMDSILINNSQGAYQATNILIKRLQVQPGYLRSSYSIHNFQERADGYYKALRTHGMSKSKSVVHSLPPSVEGAYLDMKEIIDQGETLAKCYFADNDLIAAGAMKALKEAGYKIPEDISIIGFDNMPLCTYVEPNLTTVNVPVKYMGEMAVARLVNILENKTYFPIKLEVSTNLVIRKST